MRFQYAANELQPITGPNKDKLNRNDLAKSFASNLVEFKGHQPFVIAIDGEWGSGKTSFFNLVKTEIDRIYEVNDKQIAQARTLKVLSKEIINELEPKEEQPLKVNSNSDLSIMEFNPWQINNKNDLIFTFLEDLLWHLYKNTDAISNPKITKAFWSIMTRLVPEKAQVGFEGFKLSFNLKGEDTKDIFEFGKIEHTLSESKKEINNILDTLNHRVIVVMDDIDRMMNPEIYATLQLIKGVADFNNITYLLLMNSYQIEKALKQQGASSDGERYLEKVIHYNFTLPKFSPTDINRILKHKIENLLTDEEITLLKDSEYDVVVDIVSNYVTSLRSINKLIGTMMFEYFHIKDEVNFLQFLMLTAIKITNYKIYEMIYMYKFNLLTQDKDHESMQPFIEDIKNSKSEGILELLFPRFFIYGELEFTKNIENSHHIDTYFSLYVPHDQMDSHDIKTALNRLFHKHADLSIYLFNLPTNKWLHFIEVLHLEASKSVVEGAPNVIAVQLCKLFSEVKFEYIYDRLQRNKLDIINPIYLWISEAYDILHEENRDNASFLKVITDLAKIVNNIEVTTMLVDLLMNEEIKCDDLSSTITSIDFESAKYNHLYRASQYLTSKQNDYLKNQYINKTRDEADSFAMMFCDVTYVSEKRSYEAIFSKKADFIHEEHKEALLNKLNGNIDE
jgi:hypothetical protein